MASSLKYLAVFALIFAMFACIFSFSSVNALEDQFNISLTVTAADITPPSVPTGLLATAVSSSQIDLSWNASTDDVAVTAYRVFRDNLFLATSTLTSYSDTGLSAQTAYSYTVSAVDAAFNDSGRSATSTATTSAVSTTPSGAGGGSGQFVALRIYDLSVFPAYENAVVAWKTIPLSKFVLEWGEGSLLNSGVLSDSSFVGSRQVLISGLSAGTEYLFRITVEDSLGRKLSQDGSFETFPLKEGIPNVLNLKTISNAETISLDWDNPVFSGFDSVRIVKSPFFFPTGPDDGQIIFEGLAGSFTDYDVESGKDYFYTVFVKDNFGNFSSGAIVRGRIQIPGEPVEGGPLPELPKAPVVHPQIQSLSFSDFEFIQEGRRLNTLPNDTVVMDGEKDLTVALRYEKVPEILKAIIVTLINPDNKDQVFSFLLRVNDDKTAYEATIGSLRRSGLYETRIDVIDYKNQGLKKIDGALAATFASAYSGDSLFHSVPRFVMQNFLFILFLIIIFLTIALYLVFKKNRRKTNP